MASTSTAKTANSNEGNQAVLTRFQQKVLGLTRESHGDAIRKCTKNPCTVEEVIIISLKVAVVRKNETGVITRLTLAYTSFDTAKLKSACPQDFSKIVLHEKSWSENAWDIDNGDIRPVSLALIDMFEPSCVDPNGEIVPARGRSSLEGFNARRFEHLQHLDCGRRKGILLLLAHRDEGLGILKSLGFDPYKHPYIVEVVSARLLLSSHLARTGKTASSLPSTEDVWSAGQCPSTLIEGDMRTATLATLLATVNIAIKDAKSAAAAGSTHNEVDGNSFSASRRNLVSWENRKAFLLEWSLSIEGLVRQANAMEFVKRITSMPVPFGDNSDENAVKRAKLCNHEQLLLERPSEGSRSESVQHSALTISTADQAQAGAATSTLTRSVPGRTTAPSSDSKQAAAQKSPTSSSSTSPSTSSTSSPTTAPTSSPLSNQLKAKSDSPKSKWTPSLDERLPYELGTITGQYKKLSHDFLETLLRLANVNPRNKQALSPQVESKASYAFDHIIHGPDDGERSECELCKISCYEYVQLAQKLARSTAWRADPREKLLESLNKIISKREEVNAWYQALPEADKRREGNDRHVAFIDTMREVKNILWSTSVSSGS